MASSVSVVIPAYNTERFIQDAVVSVLRQSHPRLEIIVVDDGSADATASRAEALQPEAERLGHTLHVIRQANRGCGGARNTGLSQATGEYVGLLDSDDRWHPDKVARHLEILESDPEIDLTFSFWAGIDENGRSNGRACGAVAKRPRFADLLLQNVAAPSSVIARREALISAGMFDAELPSAEDLDMWLRVSCLRHGNIKCVEMFLAETRVRGGQMTNDWRKMQLGWETVLAKASKLNSREFIRVGHVAHARAHRYWARLAYEAGDYPEARALLAKGWRMSPRSLATDRNSWPTSVAVMMTFLPRSMHKRLDAVARSAWMAQKA